MRAAAASCLACLSVLGGSCTDAGPSKALTPFTVWALEEALAPGGDEAPIAGARVALDPPGGGERVVRTTAADGHATFDADFTGEASASVTLLAEDHVFVTMLEASPATAAARVDAHGKPMADLVVVAPRLGRTRIASAAELRGAITGKRDRNDVVTLAASALPRLGVFAALEATYALRVPRDVPFFLLGHETETRVDDEGVVVTSAHVKSVRLDLPARGADATLDLDLAALPALPARAIHVRAVPDAFPAVRAAASVTSADSGLAVGLFASARAEAGAFDVEVTLVDTDVGPERLVSEAVLVAADGSRTTRAEPGVIADGTTFTGFLAPPAIQDPDAPRTVRDPIVLDGFPSGAALTAELHAGGQLFWILRGPPGGLRAPRFAVPYRDEIGSADVQVFALSVVAEADRRTATSRDVLLRKR